MTAPMLRLDSVAFHTPNRSAVCAFLTNLGWPCLGLIGDHGCNHQAPGLCVEVSQLWDTPFYFATDDITAFRTWCTEQGLDVRREPFDTGHGAHAMCLQGPGDVQVWVLGYHEEQAPSESTVEPCPRCGSHYAGTVDLRLGDCLDPAHLPGLHTEIRRLAEFILTIPGEPSGEGSAVDAAIRLVARLTRERDALQREVEHWRSGRRVRGMRQPESVPDGTHYAALLARAVGTEGGEEHDDLLIGAAQRLKALTDVAGDLLKEAIVLRGDADRARPVVEAAQALRRASIRVEEFDAAGLDGHGAWLEYCEACQDFDAAVDAYTRSAPDADGPTEQADADLRAELAAEAREIEMAERGAE